MATIIKTSDEMKDYTLQSLDKIYEEKIVPAVVQLIEDTAKEGKNEILIDAYSFSDIFTSKQFQHNEEKLEAMLGARGYLVIRNYVNGFYEEVFYVKWGLTSMEVDAIKHPRTVTEKKKKTFIDYIREWSNNLE